MQTTQRLIAAAVLPLLVLGHLANAHADGTLEPVRDGDFYQNAQFAPALVDLGRMLFFDKILSGNRNISCATCHHPTLGTSDARSLSLGEGAAGLGQQRIAQMQTPVLGRIPRNAQALYFSGAREYRSMFHDGRLEADPTNQWSSGFWSPAREHLPAGLANLLAAQAMFPVTSPIEMAGHKGENEVADAVALDRLGGTNGVWHLLAKRLQQVPEYVERFNSAFTNVNKASDITFVHAANAIAAFETVAFRADNSPFDQYLRTADRGHLTEAANRGMDLFYGAAQCAQCHSGKLQTDHEFHAIAMPQIGPGKNDGWDQSYWQATGIAARLEDWGRGRVTGGPEDNFKFRTPSLRNVELTGPWGHAGAYTSLEDAVRHHLDPESALEEFALTRVDLPALNHIVEGTANGSVLSYALLNPKRLENFLARDTWVMQNTALRSAIAKANTLPATALTDENVSDLVAFLHALTDPASRDAVHLVPTRVPSGLSVAD